MDQAAPTTKGATSDARKQMVAATSSGLPTPAHWVLPLDLFKIVLGVV